MQRIALRIQFAYSPQESGHGFVNEAAGFLFEAEQSTESRRLLLDAVDELLGFRDALLRDRRLGPGIEYVPEAWEELDRILEDGGSAWRVGPDREQLVRRVDDAVQQVADKALEHASPTAGEHLAAAWSAVYGRDPDPDRGYKEAVLAVEAATVPVVLPKDPRPTLGKAVAYLKQAAASWQLAGGGPIEAVLAVVDQLWTRQPRHATPGQPTRRVDQAEAEAAVHAAAYLVHLFGQGLITRR